MSTLMKRAPKRTAASPAKKVSAPAGPISVTLAGDRPQNCQCGRLAVYLVQRPNNARRTPTCGYHLSKVVGDFAHA